jgi:LuxR family maltose regulon positive regulatory protein
MFNEISTHHIHIPHIPHQIIYPRAVHDRLNAILRLPLTLIHAPAGYGKTTLTAHWCQQQAVTTAWVTLTSKNQTHQAFLAHIYTALLRAKLLTHIAPVNMADASIDTLIHHLHTINKPQIIVFDNMHAIQSADTWHMLHAVIDQLPHTTHMVLIGQRIPPFDLTDAYLKGHVNHINKAHLTFAYEDVDAYIKLMKHVPSRARTIHQQSEGWVMAIRLFTEAHHASADITPHKLLTQFFLGIVKQQPSDIQRLLAISLAFPRFNLQLLHSVIPDIAIEKCLQYLYTNQLFIEHTDESGEWHRYHGLMAKTLLPTFAASYQSLHLQGAAWLENHGFHDDALIIYHHYHQHEHILRLVKSQIEIYLQRGEFDQFLTSMAIVPSSLLIQEPTVAIAYAWALIMRGEYERCHHILQMFHQHAIESSDDYYVVHTICQFYRTGVVERTVFNEPEFTRLYDRYPFLHGLAALFIEDMTAEHTHTIRQPIAQLYSSTRILLRQGEYAKIHLFCNESLHNPPRHPLLAAVYGIWSEATYALNLLELSNQLAAHAHSLATSLGNHHIRLLSAALRVHTLRVNNAHNEAQVLWDDTYCEAVNQHMIPLGRVYILKELWRHALITHHIEECRTIKQQLHPNLQMIDIPADMTIQLEILGAYTTWMQDKHIPSEVMAIAEQALQHKWYASLVAIIQLLRHTSTPIPHHIEDAYTHLNPQVHMPGIMRDWQQVLHHSAAHMPQHTHLQNQLTPREYEVFILAADGLTNPEIAERLCVSLSTIKTHLINIYAKLRIKRRTELVYLATQNRNQP